MAADPLSDVLRAVRFRGAVFYDVEGAAPWVAEAPPAAALLPEVMPDVDHLMEFHGVLRGSCWAARTGEPAVRLEEGDLVLFPHGDAHVMSSAPGLRASRLDPAALVPSRRERLPLPLLVDASGARARACAARGATPRGSSAASSAATRVPTTRCSRRCRACSRCAVGRRRRGSPRCSTVRRRSRGAAGPAGTSCWRA